MMWTESAVCAALGIGEGTESRVYTAVSTDTRTLGRDALFVALRGETHDAHAFLAQAAAAGAKGAVVERVPEDAPATLHYYVVADTLAALGRLARLQRRQMGVRLLSITGSNGKTTTKDLVRAVLGARYRVHATPGNLNNLIGVPLTLLGAPADAEYIVAELGTNVPGEVAQLAAIAEPDAAVVTTVSAEHLEGLGNLEGVLREETSVLSWLPHGAPAVVSDEPPMLAARAKQLFERTSVAGFSDRAGVDFRGTALRLDDEGRVRFQWAGRDVALRLRGRHNGWNAMLALALGRLLGVADADAIHALAQVEPAKMRGELHRYGDMTVIADCYNANPGSVAAAIDLLAHMPRRGGRVLVLGTMRELGEHTASLHADAAHAALAADIDLVVATGEFATALRGMKEAVAGRVIIEDEPDAAFEVLARRLKGNEVVVLKASRGVRLERLLPRFEAKWAKGAVLHPHGEAFGSRASDSFTGDRPDSASSAEHTPGTRDRHDGPAAYHRVSMRG
jgi:UDP-N-acetylmuramoyl-tripeptide--D-alanyl-D-alanine ligase